MAGIFAPPRDDALGDAGRDRRARVSRVRPLGSCWRVVVEDALARECRSSRVRPGSGDVVPVPGKTRCGRPIGSSATAGKMRAASAGSISACPGRNAFAVPAATACRAALPSSRRRRWRPGTPPARSPTPDRVVAALGGRPGAPRGPRLAAGRYVHRCHARPARSRPRVLQRYCGPARFRFPARARARWRVRPRRRCPLHRHRRRRRAPAARRPRPPWCAPRTRAASRDDPGIAVHRRAGRKRARQDHHRRSGSPSSSAATADSIADHASSIERRSGLVELRQRARRPV